MCLVWGTTYLAIRVALETIPPLLMGGLRWTAAGALIAAFLKARGERLPSIDSWIPFALLGFLLIGLGNGGVVWAEQTVSSGLTAMLVATSPFWMVGVDAMMRDGEQLTARRIAGLIVGFFGNRPARRSRTAIRLRARISRRRHRRPDRLRGLVCWVDLRASPAS